METARLPSLLLPQGRRSKTQSLRTKRKNPTMERRHEFVMRKNASLTSRRKLKKN